MFVIIVRIIVYFCDENIEKSDVFIYYFYFRSFENRKVVLKVLFEKVGNVKNFKNLKILSVG